MTAASSSVHAGAMNNSMLVSVHPDHPAIKPLNSPSTAVRNSYTNAEKEG